MAHLASMKLRHCCRGSPSRVAALSRKGHGQRKLPGPRAEVAHRVAHGVENGERDLLLHRAASGGRGVGRGWIQCKIKRDMRREREPALPWR
jgi:hypothetical protein